MWYKNKVIVPGEIIYEIVTKEDRAGFGIAVAHIRKSIRHYHKKATEVYLFMSGILKVRKGKREAILKNPGDTIIIPAGISHSAESLTHASARVIVFSKPAWTPEDHIVHEE